MKTTSNFRFDEKTHTYWLGAIRLPSVSEILKAHGFFDMYKGVPQGSREVAMSVGKMTHEACYHYLKHGKIHQHARNFQEVKDYLYSFIEFVDGHEVEVIDCEQSVYHPSMFYAGTYDLRIIIDGKKVLTDIKTGVGDKPEMWHFLQSGAYALCTSDELMGILKLSKQTHDFEIIDAAEHKLAWIKLVESFGVFKKYKKQVAEIPETYAPQNIVNVEAF